MREASPELSDRIVAELLADPNKQEVLSWLRGAKPGEQRTLGTLGTIEKSVAFAEKIYAVGAKKVWAVEIRHRVRPMLEGDEQRENTGKLVIELPSEPAARARVFRWERKVAHSIGFDGTRDRGQPYLFTLLD